MSPPTAQASGRAGHHQGAESTYPALLARHRASLRSRDGGAGERRFRGREPASQTAQASPRSGSRETMASSSVPPAAVPAATAAPGAGFGFASKTKKKHFVQQKVKVFRAADPLVGVFLWGVAHSVRPCPGPAVALT